MNAELRNQTLVDAESARQLGFEKIYDAFWEIVKQLEQREGAFTSAIERSNA